MRALRPRNPRRATVLAIGSMACWTGLVSPPASASPRSAPEPGVVPAPRSSATGSDWSVQAQSLEMHGAACVTSSSCWAVGGDSEGNAVIAASTDGGQTWTRQSAPSGTGTLSSISCSDSLHCWALSLGASGGSAGSLGTSQAIATTDGTTWGSQSLPSGVGTLLSISCPQSSVCWAVGIALPFTTTSSGFRSALRSWATGRPGPRNPLLQPSLTGVIAESTNGGSTWATVTDPTPSAGLTSISCPAPTSCVAVGGSETVTTGGQLSLTPTALYLASSGSWSDVSGGLPGAAQGNLLGAVSCPTSTSCEAIGTGTQGSVVLSTSNPATSWSAVSFPSVTAPLNSLACPIPNQCSIGVANDLYTSTAGGTQWLAQSALASGTEILAESCGSSSWCLLLASAGAGINEAATTTNGGSTWTPDPILASSSIPSVATMDCPSSSVCFAGGTSGYGQDSGTMIATTDGGAQWSPQAVPTTMSAVAGISCPAVADCWAVGGSVIAVTTNGGAQWSPQQAPVGSGTLDSISCPDRTHCFATAETTSFVSPPGSGGGGGGIGGPSVQGSVLSTSDGGSTWASDPLPDSTGALGSIDCPSSSACIATSGSAASLLESAVAGAVGGSGLFPTPAPQIVVTSNGGTSWADAILPPGIGGIGNVSCPSATECYAIALSAAGFGTMLTSGNGGVSWQAVGLPASVTGLTGVTCPATHLCYLVADLLPSLGQPGGAVSGSLGSEILTTVDGGTTWSASSLSSAYLAGGPLACGDSTHCWALAANLSGLFAFGLTGSLLMSTSDGGGATPLTLPAQGYYMVNTQGEVYPFGAARFLGSASTITLSKPVVGSAPTPDGKGYWLVASDGGIFTFGDAGYFGSTGAIVLNKPIVGMAATSDGKGYWVVASDGGIFTFGDASYFGSTAANPEPTPIASLTPSHDGHGYVLLESDGAPHVFGSATNFGAPTSPPDGNARALALSPDGQGYWIFNGDGSVGHFGDALDEGSAKSPSNDLIFFADPVIGGAAWP